MVSFYKAPNKKTPKQKIKTVTAKNWDTQGRGVCVEEHPVMFVEGMLPGETGQVRVNSTNKQVQHGKLQRIDTASPYRLSPFCPVAEVCGGCQLQHTDAQHALAWRQQAIDTYWQKHLSLASLPWQNHVTGTRPAYRRKARLAVDARNDFSLGYRQENDKTVVDIDECPILVPALSALLTPLKTMLKAYPARRHIGHISLLAGDNVCQVSIRMTRQPGETFCEALLAFGQVHRINIMLEFDKEERVIHQVEPLLCFVEPGLSVAPDMNDFVQVNAEVNQKMVRQAIDWLSPQPQDRVADWFAGLGNFSLPLAKLAAQVQAVEGVAEMVQKGRQNALKQGVENITWHHVDLTDTKQVEKMVAVGIDKMLLDPSREGALAVCQALSKHRVSKILYVSCNPSTLLRDTRHLLDSGYTLEKLGLIEMFPYTRHLEMMALFTDTENNA